MMREAVRVIFRFSTGEPPVDRHGAVNRLFYSIASELVGLEVLAPNVPSRALG